MAKVTKRDKDQQALAVELRSGFFTDETVMTLIQQGVPKEMYEILEDGIKARAELARKEDEIKAQVKEQNDILLPVLQAYEIQKLQTRGLGTLSARKAYTQERLDRKLLVMNLLNQGMKPNDIELLIKASCVDIPMEASVSFRRPKKEED